MALTSRPAAVALPPAARFPPSSVGLDRDLDARAALDDDACGPRRRRRPATASRARTDRVDAGDVLHDDDGLAVDDALHLEAHGALGAGLEAPHHVGDGGLQFAALQRLADLVELDARGPGR
jgi:hypothetical protein